MQWVLIDEWVAVPDGRGGQKLVKVKKTKEQMVQQKAELAQMRADEIQADKQMQIWIAGGIALLIVLIFVGTVAYQMRKREVGLVVGFLHATWAWIWLGLKVLFMTTIGALLLMAGAMAGGRRRR